MKSKYTYIILTLFTVFSNVSFAQEKTIDEFVNFVGFKASNISGYGIYYSRNISENFRLQAMGIAYYYQYEKDKESKTIFNYDLGLEIQRNIYKTDKLRTYVLFGGYYYYDDDTKTNIDEVNSVNNSYNIGTGIGLEFDFKRIVYNFDLGYKFFEDDIDTFTNGDFSYNELKRVTKVGAGIGIGFKF